MAIVLDWSHQVILAPQPTSARLARDFVCLHLVTHGLEHLLEDVRLVVSELATNAVEHARTPFVLTLSLAGGLVLLALRDESLTVPVPSAPGLLDMNGRGLMIVEMLSHEWGTRADSDGFKSVWATFHEQEPLGHRTSA